MSQDVLAVLTAHVLDDDFKGRMTRVAESRTFACVMYGGLPYDFEYFKQVVRGDFVSGVAGLRLPEGGEILSAMLSRYLTANPSCSLFAHDFLSLDRPFPSIRSADEGKLRSFIRQRASMPLNLLVAEGQYIAVAGAGILAIADICDGDAWLVVAGSKPAALF